MFRSNRIAFPLVPANAGNPEPRAGSLWIPACAGMSGTCCREPQFLSDVCFKLTRRPQQGGKAMTYDPNFSRMTPYDESFRNNPLHTKVALDDTGSGWSEFVAVVSIVFIVGALILF